MKQPDKRETLKAPAKPLGEEKKIAEKPAVVTPAPDKNPSMDKPALQPEPKPAPKPHERYEHPERNA